MAVPGLEKYWGTETFVTEALTQEAIKALNKAKKYNQPFYLYMAQYAIHVPLNKDMRFYDKYKKKGMTEHGCTCLEAGILIDCFSPMRADFLKP